MTKAKSAADRLSPAVPGNPGPTPSVWALGAVFAAAFAALYLEVALIKLTSLKFHFIFAYAILGVALLGYGAAGSLLAVMGYPTPDQALRRLSHWLIAFSLAVVPAFLVTPVWGFHHRRAMRRTIDRSTRRGLQVSAARLWRETKTGESRGQVPNWTRITRSP